MTTNTISLTICPKKFLKKRLKQWTTCQPNLLVYTTKYMMNLRVGVMKESILPASISSTDQKMSTSSVVDSTNCAINVKL